MPTISIITPCYNCEKYLQETFDSVTRQTFSDFEWIIFDDQSTDKSWKILQELAQKDARLKIHQNEKNSGAAITRNNCLEKAQGDYVAFLDCDDLWHPKKLEKQLQFAKSQNADFTYHNYETIDAKGQKLKELKIKNQIKQNDLYKYNPFATSSIMIKREILTNNNIEFRKHLRRRQDYFFWFDAIGASNQALGLSETLSGYRIFSEDSLSSDKKKMAKIQWELLGSEFKLPLIKRLYYFLCYAWHGVRKYL
jgi:teichuronic acid biosynthesis glycosyltransferase TuaG